MCHVATLWRHCQFSSELMTCNFAETDSHISEAFDHQSFGVQSAPHAALGEEGACINRRGHQSFRSFQPHLPFHHIWSITINAFVLVGRSRLPNRVFQQSKILPLMGRRWKMAATFEYREA